MRVYSLVTTMKSFYFLNDLKTAKLMQKQISAKPRTAGFLRPFKLQNPHNILLVSNYART